MASSFFFLWDAGFILIAFVYPFLAVFRGQPFILTTLSAWASLLLFSILGLGVLPILLDHLERGPAAMIGANPLGFFTGVYVVLICGWVYPLVASTLGYGCRKLWLHYFRPHGA